MLAVCLTCLGVVMVASSSIAIGMSNHVGPYYFLVKHLVFLAMGMVVAGWVMRTELKSIEQRDHLLLVLCLGTPSPQGSALLALPRPGY